MNNAKKTRVLLLFGGRSGEHEVSIVSATHVKKALDPEKYQVTMVGITKDGTWLQVPEGTSFDEIDKAAEKFSRAAITADRMDLDKSMAEEIKNVDVVIPILHGTYGEDGTVQGLLELTGLPYVGCGVLASAAAMDKGVAKQLLRSAGIPVVPGHLLLKSDIEVNVNAVLDVLEERFSYPMFVKPANLGSSVGISKAHDHAELEKALLYASEFDRRILVEPAVPNARELEVAVLGNDAPEVSVVGEIVPDREFYDYESKYSNTSTSEPVIPAKLTEKQSDEIRELAEKAFRAIDGAGMSRVDFLMDGKTGEIFINEINTIPGFTPISMYPKLWGATGISYSELLDKLIDFALERASVKQALRTTK